MFGSLLGLILQIVHLLVLIFVLSTPLVFRKRKLILITHTFFCISILIHWFFNDDKCCLTMFEAWLTKTPVSETFFSRLISPIYKFGDDQSEKAVPYRATVFFLAVLSFIESYDAYGPFFRFITKFGNVGIDDLQILIGQQ